MINKFNLDTVADPENMNMLIEGINKNEEDITVVKKSVEGVSSAIGQKLDKAKLISIGSGTNRIMQLGFFNYPSSFNLYAKIMRPNLHNGSQLSYADLYIGKYSASFPVEGKLQMNIDLSAQQYKLRFVVTDTGKLYAISPLYNYSDWLLIENKNFTEDIQEVSVIDGNIVWDSDNNTTKIALQQTPTETIITSGLAPGWSGQLGIRKTQEGIIFLSIPTLLKTTAISTVAETIYTSMNVKPLRDIKITTSGINTGVGIVAGSAVDVIFQADGRIRVRSVGSVTANVKEVEWLQLAGI